jgi:hypothetical protein
LPLHSLLAARGVSLPRSYIITESLTLPDTMVHVQEYSFLQEENVITAKANMINGVSFFIFNGSWAVKIQLFLFFNNNVSLNTISIKIDFMKFTSI